jgi:hypothetical protein
MGPKKEKTPTPASDVLRDAKDAPLEGLGWIHEFIPSPLALQTYRASS